MNKKFLLLLFILGVSKFAFAQNPRFFKIGEDELANLEIYKIIQDQSRNFWIATNEGIIKYDGYTFKKIPGIGLLGNSVFELQLSHSKIFCKNLSGQVIEISNDTARVYYQIPDSLMAPDFSFFFDNKQKLHILSNAFFKVNEKLKFIFSKKELNSNFNSSSILLDGSFIFQKSGEKSVHIYKNGVLKSEYIGFDLDKNDHYIFNILDKLYLCNKKTGEIIEKTENGYIKNPFKNYHQYFDYAISSRFYTGSSTFWILNPIGGAMVFDKNLNYATNTKKIMPNIFMSCVYEDKEGNFLIGTFGGGILLIPSLNYLQYQLPDKNLKITKLTSNNKNTLYIGTQQGYLIALQNDNSFKTLIKKNNNLSCIKYISEKNAVLINGVQNELISDNSKIDFAFASSLKDIENIGNNIYIAALNTGIIFYDVNSKTKTHSNVPNFYERSYCANFNPITKKIYAGTTNGLKIGDAVYAQYYKINNEALICNDIKYYMGKIYVCTQQNGLLIFENDKLTGTLNQKNGILSNNTKQLKIFDNQIYLSSDKGFQILDINGKITYSVSYSDGIDPKKIVDFEILNNTLWLTNGNNLIPINIKNIKPFEFVPNIKIKSIYSNITALNFLEKTNKLNHETNAITFELNSKSLKYKNDIKYQYFLEGYDDFWQENKYDDNYIAYKNLAAGAYKFKVRVICKENTSKTLEYSFVILKPFWATWWFYSLIILLFLCGVYLYYNIQINKQRKETLIQNELMLSKIKAIKSQMNPHFIFNSLNSIQDLVLQQDANNAYNYIGKFAMLVRKILHHSDMDFVDFEEELKVINLYLELEKLRFKKDFNYTIKSNIENDVEIPPMLIQPFIENAIKHGLLHTKNKKILILTFTNKNDCIICEIEDNGIGREASKLINERQNKSHKSFTLISMENRFNLLQTNYKHKLGFVFEDLKNKENQSTGTKVILTIPSKRKF